MVRTPLEGYSEQSCAIIEWTITEERIRWGKKDFSIHKFAGPYGLMATTPHNFLIFLPLRRGLQSVPGAVFGSDMPRNSEGMRT